MVCNIYIAFTEKDLKENKRKVLKGDIILTDLSCGDHSGKTVNALFNYKSDKSLVPEISKWFKFLSQNNTISYGYVNAFYQSSIRPVIGFVYGIDKIVKEVGKENVIFHLPFSPVYSKKTSTYYMSEWETAGVHFYDRHDTLLPYIEKYLLDNKINFTSGKKKVPLQFLIFNPLRLWGVFFMRFIKNMISSLSTINYKNNLTIKRYEKIFIIRSSSQAITIIPYLELSDEKILIVVGSTETDKNAYELLSLKLCEKKNITIHKGVQPSFLLILKIYLGSILKILKRKNYFFVHKGITFNLKQSLSEMIVMNAGLDVYKYEIQKCISNIQSNFIFSFEQKSPHAFIDAEIAKNKKILSAQIQCVQQSFEDIPKPVPADFFLCETTKIQNAFSKSWSSDQDKLRYVGSFSGIESTKTFKNVNLASKIRICLFLGTEKDVNIKFLKNFSANLKIDKFDIIIKSHPRDSEKYDSIFPLLKHVNKYQTSFFDFTRDFDLAITFPSGVISDLLYVGKPFFVYTPSHHYYENLAKDFIPNAMEIYSNISDLIKKINTPIDELVLNHEKIIHDHRKDLGIITDFKSIEKNLNTLRHS